ncbi:hypothetical protein QBC32DRAFT_257221 [Pseudoneurospora amorphoporcata]|uniref:Uncharacterized protein n=1 Tax=Pseudoneurospora amorphoporcata TaxID=241081 RepID=A0AAN6NYZ5_9PEZI|nr:hypothetical protein QBC32DRAFT_257221 [Pseudoneurospora amorphoporcata]
MGPSSTATIDAPYDMPSLSTPITIPVNDAAPVNSNGKALDGPSAVPSELQHPATSSSLKRRNADGGHRESKRREHAVQFLENFSEYYSCGDNDPIGYLSWEEGNTQEHMYADTMPFDPEDYWSPPYTKSELLELFANNPRADREDYEETDASFLSRAMIFDSPTGGDPLAYGDNQDIFTSHNVPTSDAALTKEYEALSADNKSATPDEYSVASSDEEAMVELLDSLPDQLAQIPPSSVIKAIEGNSTPEIFDPSLRRSAPRSSPKSCSVSERNSHPADAENLLDEDIDGDEVLQHLPAAPKNSYSSQYMGFLDEKSQPLDHTIDWMQSRSISPTKYQPFTRPAFPKPLPNKSPVEGLSNTTILRTCFRLGSVFKEVAQCLRAEQEVTFELFARVSCSSRENASRVQHFQFIDLFEDEPPHLSGVLARWKNDSLVEKEISRFLDETKNQMCRCMCRPRKAKNPELGWDLEVLRIRVTNWNEIESVKSVVCYE